MKLKSHINIALNTLESIQEQVEYKINKPAYLLGSIAPDLNVAIPTHNIKSTIKRFRKRIELVEKLNPGIIQSFTLGIVMHYICDYFCYAHNINKIVPGHAVYEIYLQKHINKQMELIETAETIDTLSNLYGHINETIEIEGNYQKTMEKLAVENVEHIDSLVHILVEMNKIYLEISNKQTRDRWELGGVRIEIDTFFASMMCENIAIELLSNSMA